MSVQDQGLAREALRREFDQALREVSELGGWAGLRRGDWLLELIQRSFRSYHEHATAEYFRAKYGHRSTEFIADKLIGVAAKNSAILGAICGAVISADEVVALATAGEGGLGLPANLLLGAAAVGAEALLLVKIQLQMVANLAKLYGVPLDSDDPEDAFTILAFGLGGALAEEAGKLAMRTGASAVRLAVRSCLRTELGESLRLMFRKAGIRILEKNIVKYAVPLVSIGIGAVWNPVVTRRMGRSAKAHFERRAEELSIRG